MLQKVEVNRLLEYVVERTELFFKEELALSELSTSYLLLDVETLELDYLTSILSVDSIFNVMFAMSFDKSLAIYTTDKYTEELDFSESEKEAYRGETVADIINIVLGNSLSRFHLKGKAITLSPPVVIEQAKTICRYRTAQFIKAKIKTHHGNLQIFCIGPGELFDQNLDYLEENL